MLDSAIKASIDCDMPRAEFFGEQARRLSKFLGVRIPREYKFFYCKKCKTFIFPGKTMKVRTRSTRESHIVIKCLKCGAIKRIPFKNL